MKKYILKILLCVLSAMMLTGCGQENTKKSDRASDVCFAYQLTEPAAYVVDGSDILVSYANQAVVKRYDKNGAQTEELDLGEGYHTCLNIENNLLFAFTYASDGPVITEYNLESHEIATHTLPQNIEGVISMAVTERNIYLIYWNDEHDEEEEQVMSSTYSYQGEHAVIIDRDSYSMHEQDIKNVILLSQVSDTHIMYYAYDAQEGYYFIDYDCDSQTFGERQYNDVFGYTFGLAIDSDQDRVITADYSNQNLIIGKIEDANAKADLYHGVIVATGNDLQYQNNQCYLLDRVSNDILRIDTDQALVGNPTITLYQTYQAEVPYGCGYTMNRKVLEEDEFALSVMAGDSDYDLCMMDSSAEQSSQIRDRQAFYSLNDVPGVEEYLAACHPYIREAATDENDAIWMLPIAVDIPVLLYNDENCKNHQVDVGGIASYEELLDAADLFYEDASQREWYEVNGYQIQSQMVNQYNDGYLTGLDSIDYQTPEFEEACRLMKEHSVGDSPSLHTFLTQPALYDGKEDEYYQQVLLQLTHYYELAANNEPMYASMSARAMPPIGDEEQANVGTCIYLSVNPNSENLSATLNYISAYCQYMLQRQDTYLFSDADQTPYPDTELSKELYHIYENGKICFALPSEIFWDDYMAYQTGDMSFDELAGELNRKVRMYLKE